jgi:hypothetical protein
MHTSGRILSSCGMFRGGNEPSDSKEYDKIT